MINSIDGVHIKAISCCVPKGNYSLEEYIPEIVNDKSAKRLAKGTGFSRLGIAADDITTSDLCCRAVEPLLAKMDASAIGALVFVSQTPDYVMPATSHVLQQRLGLRNDILCLDINEGCSGYMTGVYTASLLAKQLSAPVCLLAGDTISKVTLAEDRATRSILGDAGTATIIEPGTHKINFAFASYGDRYDAIIMENSRHRMVPEPKNKGKMYMDGVGVMYFTLHEVPELIQYLCDSTQVKLEDISLFACHQANRMILQCLADNLGVPADKMPFTAGEYGNTSPATVPLNLACCQDKDLSNVLCCGFGVGLSAGAFIYDFRDTEFLGVSKL